MLNMDFNDEKNRDAAYTYLNDVMEEAFQTLVADDSPEKAEKTKNLFNTETHVYLIKNAWEILPPLPPQQWGSRFKELNYDSFVKWPETTAYNYTMDIIAPPFMPDHALYFGYAFIDEKPVKAAFYVVQSIVKYQLMPQGMVIDPLAIQQGMKPSFYIGVNVEKEDIFNFIPSKKHPLEAFVRRTNQKAYEERIYNSHMEGYYTQMTYEPGWFSSQLMEFAVNKGLHIPSSPHNDELRKSYERAKERREFESRTGIASKE